LEKYSVSEYEASWRAECGRVIAASGCADFPRSFFASDKLDLWRHCTTALDVFGKSEADSAVIAGALAACALIRNILSWPEALPGATS
jgi:hypothetical protein